MTKTKPPLTLLIAAPRGFCAGVDRAIRIVELALERYGAPVYVRHEIVHNKFVVDEPEGEGRGLRARAGRGAGRRAGRLLRPRRAQGGAGQGAGARPQLSRRHLPARLQGPSPGRAADRAGPPHLVRRPCRPSRGDRHLRPGAGRADDPDRDRRGRRDRSSPPIRTASPSSPRPRFRSTTPPRSSRSCAAASRASRRRAARTSATPPRTARRRSRRSPARCDAMLVIGAPNSSNSLRLVEVAEREGTTRPAGRARRGHRLRLARGRRARSASPPARRRPKCWCARSSTALARALRRRPRSRSRASRSGWSSSSPPASGPPDAPRFVTEVEIFTDGACKGNPGPGRLGRRDPLGRAREGDCPAASR